MKWRPIPLILCEESTEFLDSFVKFFRETENEPFATLFAVVQTFSSI